jgi:hypothetical protein
LEAGAGIEPANSGFADRDLTTWLPRRAEELIIDCHSRLSTQRRYLRRLRVNKQDRGKTKKVPRVPIRIAIRAG